MAATLASSHFFVVVVGFAFSKTPKHVELVLYIYVWKLSPEKIQFCYLTL